MVKKRNNKDNNNNNSNNNHPNHPNNNENGTESHNANSHIWKSHEKKHPFFSQKLTLGQKAADELAEFAGSWRFIILFLCSLFFWIAVNTYFLLEKPFDPYPFILLNLLLSSLAAIQAPIILMAQNRQAERDRIQAKYDYQVNRKAEREIQIVQKELSHVKKIMSRQLHQK
ncbi:DUF1003 domain-containing protein [Candidatus Woesearchaeota archaeon]|nr:DUF1003 domain-containing protein [Candidatus Woesearchaeota archaeon]